MDRDASKLLYEEAPGPEPKAGEARGKVKAAGLNFIEINQCKGWYPKPLPFIPGVEFAGTFDALSQGVTGFQPGDRVGTADGQGG